MSVFDQFINGILGSPWQAAGSAVLILTAAYGNGALLLCRNKTSPLITFAAGLAVFIFWWGALPPVRWLLYLSALPWAVYGAFQLYGVVKKDIGCGILWALSALSVAASALLIPYSWDEQTYQLALPLRFLQNGSFVPFPDNPYSFYPAYIQWFFSNLTAAGGVLLPRLIVALLTPAVLAAVWSRTRRSGHFCAVLAVVMLAVSPVMLALNRAVYVENFIVLFTLAGVCGAVELRKKDFLIPALICGVLAGAAAAVKPTGVIGAAAATVMFIGVTGSWKAFFYFAVSAAAICVFWYFRTFYYTGNCFYPYSFFPEPGTVESFHLLLGKHRYGLEGLPGIFLSWLFAAFNGKIYDGIVTGVHLVFLLPLIWLWRKRFPAAAKYFYICGTAVVSGYLIWVLAAPQSRFIAPLLPLVVIAGVRGTKVFPAWSRILLILLCAVTAVTVGLQSAGPLRHYWLSWKLFDRVRENPGHALAAFTRDPGYFQCAAYLAEHTPANARVLLLFERRGLYIPRDYRIAVPGFEPSLTPVPENAETLFEMFRKFDYIIVGSTDRDVDLQSANTEDCKKVLAMVRELTEQKKLQLLPNPGYAILKVEK